MRLSETDPACGAVEWAREDCEAVDYIGLHEWKSVLQKFLIWSSVSGSEAAAGWRQGWVGHRWSRLSSRVWRLTVSSSESKMSGRNAAELVCGRETDEIWCKRCLKLQREPDGESSEVQTGWSVSLVGCVYSSSGLLAVNETRLRNDGPRPANTSRCSPSHWAQELQLPALYIEVTVMNVWPSFITPRVWNAADLLSWSLSVLVILIGCMKSVLSL